VFISGTKDAVLMVEAGANEVSEDEMLGAILYLRLRRLTVTKPVKTVVSLASILLFCVGIALILSILRSQSSAGVQGLNALRLNQWIIRLPLALAMLVTMLAAAFLPRFLQKPLDNRLMRFLSVISLNLYIWHQVLCMQLIKPLFPVSLHDDYNLQVIYTLLSLAAAILAAMAFTYGLEHPAARFLQTLKNRKGVRPDARPAPPETV
jgi:peptidoglycan/LPS O-acetylase OafA/YrhL